MSYNLYIDDERTPTGKYFDTFVVVRTVEQAKKQVLDFGLPVVMSLDHDLGGDSTVMDFLKWLAENYFEQGPPTYYVHSANPVGTQNIISFLGSWYKVTKGK